MHCNSALLVPAMGTGVLQPSSIGRNKQLHPAVQACLDSLLLLVTWQHASTLCKQRVHQQQDESEHQ